jgi:fermentation-respiration switch protein FrsA (DUF1100 family)
LAVLLALPAVGYLYLCAWFAVHQRDFQYTLGGGRVTPAAVGLQDFADIDITTGDGERIDAWWAPPPASGGGAVLFLHGTPGTLADTVWRLSELKNSGLGVLAIDYRGYGGSTGRPSEAGIRVDARAAFDFANAASPGSRIAVFGESFGTGVAVALACERPVAGVLLNAPYASEVRLFELRGPPLPYRLLLVDQFDSEARIGGMGVPVMILHGTADTNVPIAEARRLFEAARQPKTMIEIAGAGHLAAWEGGAARPALAALAAWTAPDALAAPPVTPACGSKGLPGRESKW